MMERHMTPAEMRRATFDIMRILNRAVRQKRFDRGLITYDSDLLIIHLAGRDRSDMSFTERLQLVMDCVKHF